MGVCSSTGTEATVWIPAFSNWATVPHENDGGRDDKRCYSGVAAWRNGGGEAYWKAPK
ncbi:hypothetical protein OOU_Y34scaffold01009g1 [Pyricularia oryzae Y34]|uniref:Uncharacterized protein n=1 Tax=Pyricularia oryzae (strain Y34) TaxID=1143189 RepID=A0AA97PFQ0_PYRO3|nr:hypothetical protein OOU_Y34scaffold01009g1 [Pyricularia oryzae Y34]